MTNNDERIVEKDVKVWVLLITKEGMSETAFREYWTESHIPSKVIPYIPYTEYVINIPREARLSNLMGIHKALKIIFSEASRGYAWIKAPNEAFGGASALSIMLGGELTDLMRVRRYLDAERGGW